MEDFLREPSNPVYPLHHDKNGRLYFSYEPLPDAAVFEWTDAIAREVTDTSDIFTVGRKTYKDVKYMDDLAVKKTLVRVRGVARHLECRGAHKDACLVRETALREVRPALLARRRIERRGLRIMTSLFGPLLLVPLAAAPLVSWWTDSDHGWWSIGLAVGAYLIFGGLGSVLLSQVSQAKWWPDPTEFESRRRWRRIVALPAIVALTGSLVAAMVVGVGYRNNDPGLPLELSAAVGVTGLLVLAILGMLAAIMTLLEYRGQDTDQPEGVLFVDLVSLLAIANEWENDPNRRRDLVARLEQAARQAERLFPYIVGRRHRWLRQWGAERGRRIAAVIRKHEEMALDVSISQRGLVTASLTNALVYLVKRDWESLLVVDPEPRVHSLVRRYAPRVALAALLIGTAFILPTLLPELIGEPLSFQVTLLITAGFTLLSPDVQKAADVVRSFGK